MDLDVHGLPADLPVRLVHEDPGVGEGEPLPPGPAASRTAAAEAAWPMQMVETSARTYCMVS
jgi:hypothetical protein